MAGREASHRKKISRAIARSMLQQLNESDKSIVLDTHNLNLVAEVDMQVNLMSEEHGIVKIDSAMEILPDHDLLLRTNLIHEHRHIHSGQSHQHRHGHVRCIATAPDRNALMQH